MAARRSGATDSLMLACLTPLATTPGLTCMEKVTRCMEPGGKDRANDQLRAGEERHGQQRARVVRAESYRLCCYVGCCYLLTTTCLPDGVPVGWLREGGLGHQVAPRVATQGQQRHEGRGVRHLPRRHTSRRASGLGGALGLASCCKLLLLLHCLGAEGGSDGRTHGRRPLLSSNKRSGFSDGTAPKLSPWRGCC